jgi:rRNA-processing protein FCF1
MELAAIPTTRLRSQCATVDDALQRLAKGERVVVAGSDMVALRDRLRQAGVNI